MKHSRSKLVWCQAYPADHVADPELSRCSPATRGIWVDWLAAMWQTGQSGELRGELGQLARLGRCSESEAIEAVEELERTGAADILHVTGNADVAPVYVVRNRRMHRAAKARKSNADRQKRHRQRGRDADSNASVTLESRDRVQRLEINTTTNQGSDHIEKAEPLPLSAAWSEVVVVVRKCGVGDADAACNSARDRGTTPVEVQQVCEHFQQHSGAWGPGLLHRIISNMHGGEKVTWPAPCDDFIERQRQAAVVASRADRQQQKAEELRQRQVRKQERERLRAEAEANPVDLMAEFKKQIAVTNGHPVAPV